MSKGLIDYAKKFLVLLRNQMKHGEETHDKSGRPICPLNVAVPYGAIVKNG